MIKVPIANPSIDKKEALAAYTVIKKGWISMGKEVLKLENKIEKFIGVKHAILFNNGTSALHAALTYYGVKNGDEVIVPTLSYISSANVILYCGAKPVFCEVDPNTFNVTAEDIIKKITKKTKAIITVDLKGMPVDYDDLKKKLKKYKIPLISDSAEAFGAIYKRKKVGSQFGMHSFSFFANKNMTMGEGGLVTTNNKKMANFCKIIRNQGQEGRYNHTFIGNNYRPTDYGAAIGLEQLKKIDKVLFEKAKIAKIYNKAFSNEEFIETPFVPNYVTRHTWYMYCIKFSEQVSRKKIQKILNSKGIDTRLSFPPIHLQPIYKKIFGYKKGDFPVSEKVFKQFLDIPCWMGMGRKNLYNIINIIKSALKN
jgi:perosamine synthetase